MKLSSSCAGCFASLTCAVRIEIINLLQEKKEMSVLEIAKHFELTQPTITHHLQYLEASGILQSNKIGRKVFYSLYPKCDENACQIFH